jgi:hypothetical protein
MPASATITASDFYVFSAGTTIRSAQVNTNFNLWRGHILPVDASTTAAAVSGSYDLGSNDHYWRGVYQQYGVMYANTAGSVPAAPTAGQYAIYMKNDGVLYKKDSANVESPLGAGGGALGVTGSRASPSTITAAGGLVYNTAGSARQMWFITGDTTTGTDITANPQISLGSTVGQELIIVGRDSDRPVIFEDGNGLSLNGPWTAYANSVLYLVWDTSVWLEVNRKA